VASAVLQVEGAAALAAKAPVWLVRVKHDGTEGPIHVKMWRINWPAIVQRGSVEANLPLMPGDHIYIGDHNYIGAPPPEERKHASPVGDATAACYSQNSK